LLVVPLARGNPVLPGKKEEFRFRFKTLARVTCIRMAVPGFYVDEVRLRGKKMLHNRATGRPGDELVITVVNDSPSTNTPALFLDLREPATL
jgi:hypothetical protein